MNTNILVREELSATELRNTEARSFARHLAELGMKPFTTASVNEYKRRTRYNASSKFLLFLRALHLENVLYFTLVSAMMYSILGFAAYGLAEIAMTSVHVAPLHALYFFIVIALGTIATVVLERLKIGEWEAVPYDRYGNPIPERIKQTISKLRSVSNGTRIYIEHLTMTKDPLVFALCDNKRIYFEVWDETDFEPQYESLQ